MPPIAVTDERVLMRDGTRLATDVVVCDDGTRHPVLLIRSPYSRDASRLAFDAVALARSGWAVVLQDVRGRFDSEGVFEPFGDYEIDDGGDAVAWCAEQPWSDGRVVMTGMSYLGATQWLTALGRPPALRAISPMIAVSDAAPDFPYEGGAFPIGFLQHWMLGVASTDPWRPDADRAAIAELAGQWEELLCLPPAADPVRRFVAAYDRWRSAPQPAWPHGYGYDSVEVPVFQVAGWYDVFCESAFRNFTGMVHGGGSDRARRNQRLVVGPWTHAGLYTNLTPEVDFGPAANGMFFGVPQRMMDWLRAALDGEDPGSGISVFVMGAGRWLELECWPPPASRLRLHLTSGERGANTLHGDGRLVPESGPAGTDAFRYDPADPVRTRGGRMLGPWLPMAGPVDQQPVEERPDVLVYDSEVLDREVTVVGPVTAAVTFASSGRSADVTVKLVVVEEDGRPLIVVDGIRRVATEPGVPQRVDVEVGSTALQFRAGQRIRVEVSSSNFPRYDLNPSTGLPVGDATELLPADQVVHHGGPAESWIDLPVIEL